MAKERAVFSHFQCTAFAIDCRPFPVGRIFVIMEGNALKAILIDMH
jgi:hypothetical protein